MEKEVSGKGGGVGPLGDWLRGGGRGKGPAWSQAK